MEKIDTKLKLMLFLKRTKNRCQNVVIYYKLNRWKSHRKRKTRFERNVVKIIKGKGKSFKDDKIENNIF
jgi:hypothetical protein